MEQNINTFDDSSRKLTLSYGITAGVAMGIFNLILYFTKVDYTSWINYIVLAIYAISVYAFLFHYAKSKQFQINYGGLFKAGFRCVAVITLVMLGFAIIGFYLTPEIKAATLEAGKQELLRQGNSAAEVDKQVKEASDKYNQVTAMFTVFSNIFYGVVLVALSALFVKKQPNS
jgi:hypothetical protein